MSEPCFDLAAFLEAPLHNTGSHTKKNRNLGGGEGLRYKSLLVVHS